MATVIDAPARSLSAGSIVLQDVTWETYCQLRDAPANDRVRMTYLDGSLTLMSPALRHDQGARFLFLIVTTVAEVSRVEFEPTGTTTLRLPAEAGKEPDEGFYLGEAALRVRASAAIDLRVDPPPSLAIEVDHTGDAAQSLPTYARIGVPEVWIFRPDGPALWFGRLVGTAYQSCTRSLALPCLTPDLVLTALAARSGGAMGTLAWITWLRAWAATLPTS